MNISLQKSKFSTAFRSIALGVVLNFMVYSVIPSSIVSAQNVTGIGLDLPTVGQMLGLSQSFVPVTIKGIKIFPDNPLKFDFIIDVGESGLEGKDLEEESAKLIKYFMAGLTVPEEDLWVNLSPYEADRIVPSGFGVTEMGRDLLAQDYLLKQLTASLMYPEDDIGEDFWDKIYEQAFELYGTIDIPINTFNKVWIMPEKAVVYENEDTGFIVESRLKVLLESDYLALEKNSNNKKFGTDQITDGAIKEVNDFSSEVVREVIIPAIEQEINEGKNFSNLRQIYHSLILSAWFKRNLRESILGQVYVDKNKVEGVDIEDKSAKEKIYNQYVEAFKKGVYDYVRDEFDPASQQIIPKRYFSGGAAFTKMESSSALEVVDKNILASSSMTRRDFLFKVGKGVLVTTAVVCFSGCGLGNGGSTQKELTEESQDEIQKIQGAIKWLEKQQNIDTGLVESFSNALNDILVNQASTYDQSLAVKGLLEMYKKTNESQYLMMAQRIMDFFVQKWQEEINVYGEHTGFDIFYNKSTGEKGQNIAHMGPTLWIGDAAVELYEKTENESYFNLAVEIGQWSVNTILHYEGGIAMSVTDQVNEQGEMIIPWSRIFSTEHNLDYVSLQKKILKHGNKLLPIVKENFENELKGVIDFIRKRKNLETGLINRGVVLDENGIAIEDDTMALDTTTFAFLAFGPQGVKDELGLNPDLLIEKTENYFRVYDKNNSGIVLGFDFTGEEEKRTGSLKSIARAYMRMASKQYTSQENQIQATVNFRDPVVWYEGTGQMAVVYAMMSQWHKTQGHEGLAIAYDYEWKHVVSALKKVQRKYSDGTTGMPYASHGNVLNFLDGGWMTPSEQADSLASNMWLLYAITKYNPMGDNGGSSSSPFIAEQDLKISDEHTKGGIDFNPNKMNIEERGQGVGFNIPLDSSSSITVESLQNVNGFQPLIINIQLITNLPLLLGLDSEDFPIDPSNNEDYDDIPDAAVIKPEEIYFNKFS